MAAQQQATVIRAQTFELVNERGEKLAALTLNLQGEPFLSFSDKKGIRRLGIGMFLDREETGIYASKPMIFIKNRDGTKDLWEAK